MAAIRCCLSGLNLRTFNHSSITKPFHRTFLTPVSPYTNLDLENVYPKKLKEAPPEYPGYKICKEDFKYVERLLPDEIVPEPPSEALTGAPTPSGWLPSTKSSLKQPYFVKRTKNHMLPLYVEKKFGGNRILTKICKIDGDVWKLESDLRTFLEKDNLKEIYTQVHEVSSFIRIRGDYSKEACEFLLSKGF
ncbi:39S ribosomal protein L49, mitochondrial-like [Argonauta hians]